ncbi:MAG: PAS domain S-box protein [Phycisphaerales bacterium]|nr:MAG: PAS domain S-box protein [Phycisphaerales bacterium]
MKLTLRWKILLFTIVPIVGIHLSAMVFNMVRMKRWTTNSMEQRMSELAGHYVHHIDSPLREAAGIATSTAAFIESHPGLTSEELYAILRANVSQDAFISGSAICFEPHQYQKDHRLFVRYVHRDEGELREVDPSKTGYDYTEAKQEYWHVPRNTGKPLWTEPYFDEGAGNILMATYAVPFFREGSFLGIATVDISLEPLRELMGVGMPSGASFSVITQKGKYVYSPHRARINKSFREVAEHRDRADLIQLAQAIAAGKMGVAKLSGWTSDTREWVFHTPIESAGWGFALSMPKQDILGHVQEQFGSNILFLAVSLVLIVASLWFISSQISRPITRLSLAAKEIAAGNLGVKTDIRRDDEIGALGAAFDDMTQRLAHREEALKASERNYREIFDASTDAVFIHNMDTGDIVDVNRTTCEMFGYSRDEALRLAVEDVSLGEPPFSQEDARRKMRKAAEEGTQVFEWLGKRKDGEMFWVEVCLKRAVIGGKERILAFIRDITERRQAAEALQTERDFAESLIETAQAIVLVLDPQGRIVRFNPHLEELSGYRLEEVKGKDWFDTFLPERDWEPIRSLFARAVGDIQTRGNVNPIVTKDGRERDIEWYDKTLKDSDGNVIGVLAIGQDITERRQAEEALRKSEIRLREIAETIEDVFWVTDWSSHKTVFATQAYERIWGRPLQDLYNDVGNWADAIYPDDRQHAWDMFVELGEGHVYDEEYRIIRPDGSMRWIRDRGFPIRTEEGQVTRVVGVAQDITGRKSMEEKLRESETRFRELFKNMTSGVAVYEAKNDGEDFIFEDLNEAGGRLSGTTARKVVGRSILEAFPGVREMGLFEVFQRVWKTGNAERHPVSLYEDERLTKWFENQVYKLPSGEIVAVYDDITEQKLAEEAARRAQEQLLEFQRSETERIRIELDKVREQLVNQTRLAAVGQVAASIAHELRNPLGAVRNAAYYLKRHVASENPKLPEYLWIIDNEVSAADRVIRDMMEMARAKEPFKETVDLGRMIRKVSAQLCPQETVDLRLSLESEPFTVRADPGQLQQVIANLLTNAVQATSGKGEIIVDARRSGDYDKIEVRDSGSGICIEDLERVFEPLFTTKARGTGLGLTICRQIIERHGGTIDLVDEEGRGATFRIRLPQV